MGALTLKTFPFELRGWDIEKFESIDPTDGFGSNTRVYISKDQIVQIEPDYNSHTFNTWITDKGRQFFDGIFGSWGSDSNQKNSIETNIWFETIQLMLKTLYVFDHCNKHQSKNHFFTIVFENISIEILGLLKIIEQNYSFIKLRRAENYKINNDFESDFQLNSIKDKNKLSSSTICLLISTNSRYEGFFLNLNLRQRYFKGDFKCLTLGSFIDLTFPVSFLGSNLKVLRDISEGNHLLCQDLKISKNNLLVYNMEMLKRHDGKNIVNMLKMLKYSNIFNKTWNGLNTLSPSLSETGNQVISNVLPLNNQDLSNFSSLYFLNVNFNSLAHLKKIAELKLLNYVENMNSIHLEKLILNQTSNFNTNVPLYDNLLSLKEKDLNKYLHLPTSMFYENQETFINTEGYFKRTTKLINTKKTKNSWQILRRFIKKFKYQIKFLETKENNIIFFNSKKRTDFNNYLSFQYYATQSLTNLSFYLNIQTKSFFLKNNLLKEKQYKIMDTKIKYWLDDFFSGGKDEYSHNSLVLTNCSRILRTESTNFF